MVCLFMGMGLTQLSAQSVEFTGTFDYWQPVYCNGVQIDYLTGTTTYSGIRTLQKWCSDLPELP